VLDPVVELLWTGALAGTKATSWDGDRGSLAIRLDYLVVGSVYVDVQKLAAIVETFAEELVVSQGESLARRRRI